MTVRIPIRNVWLLQLFASNLYQASGARAVAAETNPNELPELVAGILADEVSHRLHTGLTVGFRETSRPVTRVRGKINALPTERHQLLRRGQVWCTFDEIVTDVPANRLARAALERAAQLVPGNPRYRSLALQLAAGGVVGPRPPLSDVPSLLRQRLLARDRLMIAAAELVLTLTIPATDPGEKWLPVPSLDEHYLRRLFEHATYGVYRHHLGPKGWTVVHGQWLKWAATDHSPGMEALLPGMQTDVVLVAPADEDGERRRIVIDTKFTSITQSGHYRATTLKSAYVYQIYSYLMSQDGKEPTDKTEGLMLHPAIGESVDEEVTIQGHRIRFATVDLTAPVGRFTDGFLGAISAERAPALASPSTVASPPRA